MRLVTVAVSQPNLLANVGRIVQKTSDAGNRKAAEKCNA
jgi:hypothetical protein